MWGANYCTYLFPLVWIGMFLTKNIKCILLKGATPDPIGDVI